MSEEKENISKYETISKHIDDHFFCSPKDFANESSSFKSYNSWDHLDMMVTHHAGSLSEDERETLLRRIELYRGITKSVFAQTSHLQEAQQKYP